MVQCIVHLSDGPAVAIGGNMLDICVAVCACVKFMCDNLAATQPWYDDDSDFWQDILDGVQNAD